MCGSTDLAVAQVPGKRRYRCFGCGHEWEV